jgi:hypothetical protein
VKALEDDARCAVRRLRFLERRKDSDMSINKSIRNANYNKVIDGMDTHFTNVKTIPLDGTPTAVVEMKSTFRAAIDANAAADAARARWKEAVAQARAANSVAQRTRRQLEAYLLVHYGTKAVGVLEDFGYAPPKPTGARAVRTKFAALGKREATRKARHTMGKKQRLRIKGVPPAPPAQSNGAANGG